MPVSDLTSEIYLEPCWELLHGLPGPILQTEDFLIKNN